MILCERGVRTFSDFSRNTLDLAVVPAVNEEDQPSAIVGIRPTAPGVGTRWLRCRGPPRRGADGLLVEVHHDPDRALSEDRSPSRRRCSKS